MAVELSDGRSASDHGLGEAAYIWISEVLEADRFRYNADIATARYIVLGDIDTRWTIHQENVWPSLERISQEKWPIVWSGKYYLVAENPTYPGREKIE